MFNTVSQTQSGQRGIQPRHSPALLPEEAIQDLGVFVRGDFFLILAPVTAASAQRVFTSQFCCLPAFFESSSRPALQTAPNPNGSAAGSGVSPGAGLGPGHQVAKPAPRRCRLPEWVSAPRGWRDAQWGPRNSRSGHCAPHPTTGLFNLVPWG